MTVLNQSVLVLNRSYLPVHVTSARRAFSLLYQGIARAVNEEYRTFDFEEWSQVAQARDNAEFVGTVRGPILVPRVIVLLAFDRLPKRHVRFSRINIMTRDRFQCQYCAKKPQRAELNLDHVVPRAQGGESTWDNCVLACVACNKAKADRTPKQASIRLRKAPVRPSWRPLYAVHGMRIESWSKFVSEAYWNAALKG